MKYVTDDGKTFSVLEEAEKHEFELEEIKKKNAALEVERKKFEEKIRKTYEEYVKLSEEYKKLYGKHPTKTTTDDDYYSLYDLFNSIFG